MTTRLNLFREALRICGAATISALTDETEGRRLLDEVWDDSGVRRCLEAGQWKFALRTQNLDYDTAVTPNFGYRRAFQKGADWVRTVGVWSDEYLRAPLTAYQDEGDYLYADLDEIWVQFVSDDSTVGGDLSTWPGSFSDYAAAYFAGKVCHRLTSDKERIDYILHPRTGILDRALKNALSKDAMRGPAKFFPAGSWVRSRGRGSSRGPFGDGGATGSLTG